MTNPYKADRKSLEEAHRRLHHLEDAIVDEDGEAPAWVIAAQMAVQRRLNDHA